MELPKTAAEQPSEAPMTHSERSWLGDLSVLTLSAGATVLVMFLLWEAIEQGFSRSDRTAHLMHYARGISSSLVTATVMAWLSFRQHRRRALALEGEVRARTAEAREAQAFLQLVVDTTPASVLVLDKDLNVVHSNQTAARVHGQSLTGHTCYEALVGRDESCERCDAREAMETGRPMTTGGEHVDPRTGEILAVEGHPLRLPDGRSFVVLVERIVTEQKKLEARLLHQEKMAAFGLLAAGVAHDMGNPLSSIGAQLQLLDDETLPIDAREVVATVRQEMARLQRILRELVDFARRRRDEASLVSVQGVVTDALRLLRHDRRMRDVRVVEEFDSETPPVFVVEDHLIQVVLNLLINALDAMPSGGSLRIEIRPSGSRVVLRVHDTGVGMDRAVLLRCFEPLYTTKEPGRGTGLGLSISREIVQAAGGSIEIHSAPGRGTTAVTVLPAAQSEASDPVRPLTTSRASV